MTTKVKEKSIAKYEQIILETHLDTFGHMNNAVYLTLYEQARWELIAQNGFGLEQIRSRGVGPVILEVNLKYFLELGAREKITITTELLEYQGKIGKLKQQMIKTDGKVASEAIFVFALFDLNARKIIPPTEEWLKAIS